CVGIGHSAATHHSGNYYPMYAHFPGLRVVVPASPYDAKGLLKHALRSNDPVLFLEPRELLGMKGPVPTEDYEIPFGQAAVVREGTDLTLVAIGRWVECAGEGSVLRGVSSGRKVPMAVEACQKLAAEGASIEIIDPGTVAPLDIDA